MPAILDDLWRDLHQWTFFWQIGAVLLSIVLGHWLAKTLHDRFASSSTRERWLRFDPDRFARVLSPLLIYFLLLIAQKVLGHCHLVSLIKLATPFAISITAVRFILFVLRRVVTHSERYTREFLVAERYLVGLVWLGMALYVTGVLPDIVSFLTDTTVPFGRSEISIALILQGMGSVALTVMIAMWASTALEQRLMQFDRINLSLRALLARASRAIFVFLAILVSLSGVGIDLTVLSVFGGALGVGLGLGLQRIVNNYVSGFIILMDGSLSIGDMITVNQYYGKVSRINTRYSVIESLSGIEYVIPNETLVFNPIENHSLSNRLARVSTTVGVGYHSDIHLVKKILEECAQGVPRIVSDPAPNANLTAFGDSALQFELSFWIADPENGKMGVASMVNFRIWEKLKENGIEIPYPIRDVRLKESRPSTT